MHSQIIDLASQHFIEHLQCTIVFETVLGSCCKIGDLVFNLCASIHCGRPAQVINRGIERPSLRRVRGTGVGWGVRRGPPLLNLRISRQRRAEGIAAEGIRA